MKYSKQRNIILDEVLKEYKHKTAEEVYNNLRKTHKDLSLGTVYRNLKVLSDSGSIKKISIPNKKDVYDKTLTEHYHFICDECFNVYDMKIKDIDSMYSILNNEDNHEINDIDLVFRGKCFECKKKGDKNEY